MAQNILLLVLIYHYQRRTVSRTLMLLCAVMAWGTLFLSGILTAQHLSSLYDVNNAILLASRIPQIYQNHASKSTGQLSPITYGLNLAGASARIFTTMQETNAGTAMLRGAILSTKFILQRCLPTFFFERLS